MAAAIGTITVRRLCRIPCNDTTSGGKDWSIHQHGHLVHYGSGWLSVASRSNCWRGAKNSSPTDTAAMDWRASGIQRPCSAMQPVNEFPAVLRAQESLAGLTSSKSMSAHKTRRSRRKAQFPESGKSANLADRHCQTWDCIVFAWACPWQPDGDHVMAKAVNEVGLQQIR